MSLIGPCSRFHQVGKGLIVEKVNLHSSPTLIALIQNKFIEYLDYYLLTTEILKKNYNTLFYTITPKLLILVFLPLIAVVEVNNNARYYSQYFKKLASSTFLIQSQLLED